jgi:hypothetical protein
VEDAEDDAGTAKPFEPRVTIILKKSEVRLQGYGWARVQE